MKVNLTSKKIGKQAKRNKVLTVHIPGYESMNDETKEAIARMIALAAKDEIERTKVQQAQAAPQQSNCC